MFFLNFIFCVHDMNLHYSTFNWISTVVAFLIIYHNLINIFVKAHIRLCVCISYSIFTAHAIRCTYVRPFSLYDFVLKNNLSFCLFVRNRLRVIFFHFFFLLILLFYASPDKKPRSIDHHVYLPFVFLTRILSVCFIRFIVVDSRHIVIKSSCEVCITNLRNL